MKIGQTYRIKFKSQKGSTDGAITLSKIAKLIQETKYFYVFEYQSVSGDPLRVTIEKFKYKTNPEMIKELKGV